MEWKNTEWFFVMISIFVCHFRGIYRYLFLRFSLTLKWQCDVISFIKFNFAKLYNSKAIERERWVWVLNWRYTCGISSSKHLWYKSPPRQRKWCFISKPSSHPSIEFPLKREMFQYWHLQVQSTLSNFLWQFSKYRRSIAMVLGNMACVPWEKQNKYIGNNMWAKH